MRKRRSLRPSMHSGSVATPGPASVSDLAGDSPVALPLQASAPGSQPSNPNKFAPVGALAHICRGPGHVRRQLPRRPPAIRLGWGRLQTIRVVRMARTRFVRRMSRSSPWTPRLPNTADDRRSDLAVQTTRNTIRRVGLNSLTLVILARTAVNPCHTCG